MMWKGFGSSAGQGETTLIAHGAVIDGSITSGGFGPSVGAPIAMARVKADVTAPGTRLEGEVRGKRLPVTVVTMPFHPTTYKR